MADMRFVQNFTPPDFKAKTCTPSISPNFNSFRSLTTPYKNIRTQMDYFYVCFAITAKLVKVWIEELLCCVQVVWFPCVSAPLTNSHYKLDPTIPIQ